MEPHVHTLTRTHERTNAQTYVGSTVGDLCASDARLSSPVLVQGLADTFGSGPGRGYAVPRGMAHTQVRGAMSCAVVFVGSPRRIVHSCES